MVAVSIEAGVACAQRWLTTVKKQLLVSSLGLSVFGSRRQAKDHSLRTVQRSCVPDLTSHAPRPPPWRALLGRPDPLGLPSPHKPVRGKIRCGWRTTYKPAHIHLGDWGVFWGTCKAGPKSEHNGGHSPKRAVNVNYRRIKRERETACERLCSSYARSGVAPRGNRSKNRV